jgi:Spy/CpxP family protein refolding chaperone
VTRNDLLKRMRDLQMQSIATDHQRDAIRKLYDAATMMNDGKLADTYRQQLHDLLDAQLDNSSSLMQLTRTLIDSAGS